MRSTAIRIQNADPEIVAEAGPRNEVSSKPAFRARKREEEASYWWGDVIRRFMSDDDVTAAAGTSPSQHETATRALATEDRFTTDEDLENRASKGDPAWPPLQPALWQRQKLT